MANRQIKSNCTIQNLFNEAILSISDTILKSLIENILNDYIKKHGKIYKMSKSRQKSLLYFINAIKNQSISDITWAFLCNLVSLNGDTARYCSFILLYLIDNDLYAGEFKDKLQSIKILFDANYWKSDNDLVFAKQFIGNDIKYYFFVTRTKARNIKSTYYYLIKTNNDKLWGIFAEFLYRNRDLYCGRKGSFMFFSNIGESLGINEDKIIDIPDFNYNTYITQLSFFLKFENATEMLLMLNRMYVHLIEHESGKGKNIFHDTDDIDLSTLKRYDLAQRTVDGYKFHYYNPFSPVPNDDKWILHINGFENTSTKANPNKHSIYDFTRITCPLYRGLVKDIIWLNSKKNFVFKQDQYYMLIEILNFIYEAKIQPEYPNKSLTDFNIFEATLIRKHIDNLNISQSTKEAYLCSIREYLQIQNQNKTMNFETMFFDYLKKFKVTVQNTAKAIPIDDLEKINSVMIKYKNDSYFNELCYAIFHLCLQTEFRISQICQLKVDCIDRTMKNNQFAVNTRSKTSNRQEYSAVIPDMTKAHIEDIIKLSESVRTDCTDTKVKDSLFLYKSQHSGYRQINKDDFRDHFIKCCTEAKIPIYTANNIRDTHITQAEEFRMRNNLSDVAVTILSGHKRIDTAHNHYIETELTKMLESTYGIILGDVEISGQIIESNNDATYTNKEHSVERGCGYCGNDTCVVLNSISCLMCNHFKTTVGHESYFKEYIAQIDILISEAPTKHDKDDLVNIKRLYCAYLLAIWKKKGIKTNE